VLLLVPKKSYEDEVKAIASIENLLEDSALVAKLLKCISPQEAFKLIQAAGDGK